MVGALHHLLFCLFNVPFHYVWHRLKNFILLSTDINLFVNKLRHEVIGEVVEVGSNVGKFRVGERVGVGCIVGCCGNCRPCKSDVEQYCNKKIWSYNDVYTDGKPTQGGFAGSMVVDQK